MREIRFRAMKDGQWKVLEFYEGAQLWARDLLELIAKGEAVFKFDTPMEQFTGLRDKNEREIYEGDVIEGKYIGGEVRFGTFQVELDEDSEDVTGWYIVHKSADGKLWNRAVDNYMSQCEVIGNIHENPDLLPDAQKRGE